MQTTPLIESDSRALIYVLSFLEHVKFSGYRRDLEEGFLTNYFMLKAQHFEGVKQHNVMSDPGRANVYHPQVSREIRRIVGSLRKALFPSSNPFIVTQKRPGEEHEKSARAIRYKLINILDDISIVSIIEPFLYEVVGKGCGAIKLGWGDNATARVVDMFSLFVYPETADSVDSAFCVMEQIIVDRSMLERGAMSGMYNADAVQSVIKRKHADISDAAQSQLRRFGPTSQQGNLMASEHEIIEYWGFYPLNGEDQPLVDCIISICDRGTVLRAKKNDLGFRPYVSARCVQLASEFYGFTPVDTVTALQQHLNTVNNQALDCATFSLNPIAAIDPAILNDPNLVKQFVLSPGQKWPVHPESIAWRTIPDVSSTGYKAAAQLSGVISNSLHSDFSLPAAGKTATAYLGGAGVISDILSGVVGNIESQCLTPMLHKLLRLAYLNMPQEEEIAVTGEDGVVIGINLKRDDIEAGVSIRWAAAEMTMAAQIKSQQLIQFFSIASRVPPQMWMSFGIRFRLDRLLKTLWSEAFNLHGEDRLFENIAAYAPLDANVENSLLAEGVAVPVHPLDNDMEHLAVHSRIIQNPQSMLHQQQHQMKLSMMMGMAPMGQAPSEEPQRPSEEPNSTRPQDQASGQRPTGGNATRGEMV